MLRIGRNLRDLDCPFKDEIEFSYENNFDIIQVWYKCGKIDSMYDIDPIKSLKDAKVKSIIHAAMDVDDFELYEDDLIEKVIELEHKELILHPMIKSREVDCNSVKELEDNGYILSDSMHRGRYLIRQNGIDAIKLLGQFVPA